MKEKTNLEKAYEDATELGKMYMRVFKVAILKDNDDIPESYTWRQTYFKLIKIIKKGIK